MIDVRNPRPLAYESWRRRRAPIGVSRVRANGNLVLSIRTVRRAWHFVKPRGERWRRLWSCRRDCPECRVWPGGRS